MHPFFSITESYCSDALCFRIVWQNYIKTTHSTKVFIWLVMKIVHTTSSAIRSQVPNTEHISTEIIKTGIWGKLLKGKFIIRVILEYTSILYTCDVFIYVNVYARIGLCSQQNSCELEFWVGEGFTTLCLCTKRVDVRVDESKRERGGQVEGTLMIFLISITKKANPKLFKDERQCLLTLKNQPHAALPT